MKKMKKQSEGITAISNLSVVHQAHYVCEFEFRWTCIDDLFCFLNTLRGGSSGVCPCCTGEFAVVGRTSLSPLRLSTVPLLLGSVLLRRMLPPTDCTGLPGASATGESPSLVIPSVRTPCATKVGEGLRISCETYGDQLTVVLLGCSSPSHNS